MWQKVNSCLSCPLLFYLIIKNFSRGREAAEYQDSASGQPPTVNRVS